MLPKRARLYRTLTSRWLADGDHRKVPRPLASELERRTNRSVTPMRKRVDVADYDRPLPVDLIKRFLQHRLTEFAATGSTW